MDVSKCESERHGFLSQILALVVRGPYFGVDDRLPPTKPHRF